MKSDVFNQTGSSLIIKKNTKYIFDLGHPPKRALNPWYKSLGIKI